MLRGVADFFPPRPSPSNTHIKRLTNIKLFYFSADIIALVVDVGIRDRAPQMDHQTLRLSSVAAASADCCTEHAARASGTITWTLRRGVDGKTARYCK